MNARSRIGLYGGTFDPVHLGHLAIARNVCELFEIGQVVFIPAQMAPHKVGREVTPPLYRYAMLVLATQNDPRLLVSTFELDSQDTSYTVDTLAHFKALLGPSCDLFFIMGADSWSEITTWRDWKRVLSIANHIVVTRPGYDIQEQSEELRSRLIDVRSVYQGQEPEGGTGSGTTAIDSQLLQGGSGKVFVTNAVMKDVSATEVRLAVNSGRLDALEKLVPEPVAEYIRKYGIYRKSNGPQFHSQKEIVESAD